MERRTFLKSLSSGAFCAAACAGVGGLAGHQLFEHTIQTKKNEAENGGDPYTLQEQLQDERSQEIARNISAGTCGLAGLLLGLNLR